MGDASWKNMLHAVRRDRIVFSLQKSVKLWKIPPFVKWQVCVSFHNEKIKRFLFG